jgi:hypothetical protein
MKQAGQLSQFYALKSETTRRMKRTLTRGTKPLRMSTILRFSIARPDFCKNV